VLPQVPLINSRLYRNQLPLECLAPAKKRCQSCFGFAPILKLALQQLQTGAPIKNKKSETRRNGVKSDPTNYRIKDFYLIDKNLKKIKTSQELL
jgi:hypothetical protein